MKVGYVGLGAMGRALAAHLIGTHDLLVWDLSPDAMASFVARGARAAGSLADMGAQCDLVLLCLPKSANVREALFGKGGLASTLSPGAIVIDQTSGAPEQSRAFSQMLEPDGITLIDAPVAGGVPSAIAGQITIMASGSAAAYERALPVLRAISPKVHRCSDQVGDGQALKAINNMINAANRVATLEIVAIGRRLGLDAAAMTDALNGGAGRSFITHRLLPAVVQERSSTDFALILMVKDLNQAADLGIASGVPMPISDTARAIMNIALNTLPEGARLDDVVPFMEGLTKIKFAGPATTSSSHIDAADAMALVVSGIAACNRVTILENTALALKAGLKAADFAPVINGGSASSAEAEQVFGDLLGEAAGDARTVGGLVEGLTALSQIGAAAGAPMTMVNQVRAACLACVDTVGSVAPLSAMTPYFVRPHAA